MTNIPPHIRDYAERLVAGETQLAAWCAARKCESSPSARAASSRAKNSKAFKAYMAELKARANDKGIPVGGESALAKLEEKKRLQDVALLSRDECARYLCEVLMTSPWDLICRDPESEHFGKPDPAKGHLCQEVKISDGEITLKMPGKNEALKMFIAMQQYDEPEKQVKKSTLFDDVGPVDWKANGGLTGYDPETRMTSNLPQKPADPESSVQAVAKPAPAKPNDLPVDDKRPKTPARKGADFPTAAVSLVSPGMEIPASLSAQVPENWAPSSDAPTLAVIPYVEPTLPPEQPIPSRPEFANLPTRAPADQPRQFERPETWVPCGVARKLGEIFQEPAEGWTTGEVDSWFQPLEEGLPELTLEQAKLIGKHLDARLNQSYGVLWRNLEHRHEMLQDAVEWLRNEE